MTEQRSNPPDDHFDAVINAVDAITQRVASGEKISKDEVKRILRKVVDDNPMPDAAPTAAMVYDTIKHGDTQHREWLWRTIAYMYRLDPDAGRPDQ